MRENYHTGTTLTKDEWINVLSDPELTKPLDIDILQVMYSFEDRKASASQIGLILGIEGKYASSPLNLEMGRWGKRVAEKYQIRFTRRADGSLRKWDIFFNGWQEDRRFKWQIKQELVEALETLELTGEEQYPEELPRELNERLFEGARRTISVNSYERNSKARRLCIQKYGTACSVCEFDFKQTYGEIGQGFIHIHHLTRVSDIGNEYEVNPLEDLRPVCPNCHAMIHKTEPPLTIEELKSKLITT